MSYLIKIKGAYNGNVYVKNFRTTYKEVDAGIILSCPVQASAYPTLDIAEDVCSSIYSYTNIEVEPIELRHAFYYYHEASTNNTQ